MPKVMFSFLQMWSGGTIEDDESNNFRKVLFQIINWKQYKMHQIVNTFVYLFVFVKPVQFLVFVTFAQVNDICIFGPLVFVLC